MGLVHVSGADPRCRICDGTGVRGFMGFGMECHCVSRQEDGFDLLMAKLEASRNHAPPAKPLPKRETQ